jgi:hypothetical protein
MVDTGAERMFFMNVASHLMGPVGHHRKRTYDQCGYITVTRLDLSGYDERDHFESCPIPCRRRGYLHWQTLAVLERFS